MNHHPTSSSQQGRYSQDMAKGFKQFVDDVMRGRENKAILNGSIGLAALETGIPDNLHTLSRLDIPSMLINNSNVGRTNLDLASHPLFDFSPENFTLFGLDFPDMWKQTFAEHYSIPNPLLEETANIAPLTDPLFGGAVAAIEAPTTEIPETIPYISDHYTPHYDSNLAETIGLPDLPYGGLAHFAHMGMAVYDTGRTFQDLWNEPALKHNVFKIMTHPEMSETLLHRGVMLSVMGMLHPLGGVIAIGVGYLCAHLVHTAFKFLNNHKDTVQEVMQLPVLKTIYDATGIKEWAEAKDKQSSAAEQMDPLQEPVTSAQFSNGAREKYIPVNHIETLNSERVGALGSIPLRSVS